MKRLFLFFTIFFLPALHAMGDSSRRISVAALLNPSATAPALPSAATPEPARASTADEVAPAIAAMPCKYQCVMCPAIFAKLKDFVAHCRRTHKLQNTCNLQCRCGLCPDHPLMKAHSLKRHHISGHLPRCFHCPFCGKWFNRRDKLRSHRCGNAPGGLIWHYTL